MKTSKIADLESYFCSYGVEIIDGKLEIACFEQFLHFLQCFFKLMVSGNRLRLELFHFLHSIFHSLRPLGSHNCQPGEGSHIGHYGAIHVAH